MASTYSKAPHLSGSSEPSAIALTQDYDDDIYSSSSHGSHASLRKPLSSFDDEDLDLEDGFAERPHKVKSWWNWKHIMTLRERGKASLKLGGYKDLNRNATRLLADVYAARRTRRQRNWYNYCVFGGISGLTILLVSFPLQFSIYLHHQRFSTRAQPPPESCDSHLDIRPRPCIAQLGTTWDRNRRARMVPYRLHTRHPTYTLPFPQRLLATSAPLLRSTSRLHWRRSGRLALRQRTIRRTQHRFPHTKSNLHIPLCRSPRQNPTRC